VLRQYRAKNPAVVALNPKCSTIIPDTVFPTKLPREKVDDHMPKKALRLTNN